MISVRIDSLLKKIPTIRQRVLQFLLVGPMVLFSAVSVLGQGHQHINAGAFNSEPGAALYFVNGARFAAESGYVFPAEPAGAGPFEGEYRGTVTFTALAATPDFGGPAFDHAAPGARLELEVMEVHGPANARFGFWEGAGDNEGTEPTFEISTGTTSAAQSFHLSESNGEPGADPYGHVHGRVFTFSEAGFYGVTFRIVDTSSNGADGGPVHSPSEPYTVQFQAGVSLAGIEVLPEEQAINVRFAAPTGFQYQIEASSAVGLNSEWTPVGEVVTGDDHLHEVQVPITGGSRFLRLRRDAG